MTTNSRKKSKKLCLHIGLPKTGSSALQNLFYEERQELIKSNILYPNTIQNSIIPKHRWLIHALLKNDMTLLEELKDLPEEIEKVILSEESISNDFYNIDTHVFTSFISALHKMKYEIDIYLVIREKKSWSTSYYKQCIINAASNRNSLYSTSMLYQDFINNSSFSKLLNYDYFVKNMQKAMGTKVVLLDYDKLSIQEMFHQISGIQSVNETPDKKINESIPDHIIEVFRQLNHLVKNPKEKNAWAKVIQLQSNSKHVALNMIAKQVSNDDIANLDSQKLDQIMYVDNTPLLYTEYILDELIKNMKKIILDLKNS